MNLNHIKNFFSTYALYLMGGALAVSLLGNVLLTWRLNAVSGKKAECVAAVVTATEKAKEKIQIVNERQDKNVKRTQDSVTGRIADTGKRLSDSQSRIPVGTSTGGPPEGSGGTSGTSFILPDGYVAVQRTTYENDQRVCVKNTILAEEWPKFYFRQQEIWDEEYGNKVDSKSNRVSSSQRGAGVGSLQGLSRSLDLGTGSDRQIGSYGISLQGQSIVGGEGNRDFSMVDEGKVSTGGSESLSQSE